MSILIFPVRSNSKVYGTASFQLSEFFTNHPVNYQLGSWRYLSNILYSHLFTLTAFRVMHDNEFSTWVLSDFFQMHLKFSTIFISSGDLVVDTFLLISGLGLGYRLMQVNAKTPLNIPLLILHRYLRWIYISILCNENQC